MRNIKAALALTFAFAAGCVAKEVVIPAVRASDGAEPSAMNGGAHPVVRWEYMCIDGWGGVARSSNQLGKEGWEMAAGAGTSDHMMWCFKRALP
jgi:hypothetical protein